jgi:PKD repeat protein
MKNALLVFLAMMLSFFAQAKTPHTHKVPEKRNCSSIVPSDAWEQDFQQHVAAYLANTNPQSRINANYTIPVVVHVVYYNAEENISQAQVNSQIEILNKDFAGIGLNVGNVPNAFSTLVSNTNIQFCLAQKKPDGTNMTEPGIDRVSAVSKGFKNPGTGYLDTYIDGTIKPATIWDPTKYLNIWVLKIEENTLGYATFPAMSTLNGISADLIGDAETDGVVIGHYYFGNTGVVEFPYDEGRTATHEVGHWLGLRHIWGDGLCGNDFCADTPTQFTSNTDCPNFPQVTCFNGPNGDMFMNFMDYVDDACMFMFTPDQRTRMQTAMANGTYRAPLINSNVCTITPQAPVANFTATPTTICPGGSVKFTDLSANSPTSWQWTFQGGTPASSTQQSPTVTYASAGTYTVTLKATNALGNNTKTVTSYVTVATPTGAALPFLEGFQNATFPPTNWSLVSNSGFNWQRHTGQGGFGASNACMKYNNTDNDGDNKKDDIITPVLNLSGANTPRIKFDVAHAPYNDGVTFDTLEVLIQDACASTPVSIYKKGGTQLATAPAMSAEFYPTASQWRKDSVLVPSGFLNKQVKFIFRNYGRYGHTIYVDNVNVYGLSTSAPTATASFTLSDTVVCAGSSLTFTNTSTASSGSPDSLRWTIQGGTPATSTSTTTVAPVFNTAGNFTISLVAYKSGNASTVFSRAIRVKSKPTVTVNSPTICSGNTTTLNAGGATTYTWSPNIGNTATVTTPVLNSNTSYTVTGTTNGCSATATATVTVKTTPTVTVNSPTICSGNTTTLNAGGATTYTWSPNIGNTATVTTPVLNSNTSYTVTGTTNGCSATATASVTVNPTPATPVITQRNDTLFSSVVLSGASYEWYLGGVLKASTSTAFYKFNQAGVYTVKVTKSSCPSALSTTFNGILTALRKYNNTFELNVAPNPTSGYLNIRFLSAKPQQIVLRIYSVIGQKVWESEMDVRAGAQQQEIQLHSLDKGMYILSLEGEDNLATQQIIIQ